MSKDVKAEKIDFEATTNQWTTHHNAIRNLRSTDTQVFSVQTAQCHHITRKFTTRVNNTHGSRRGGLHLRVAIVVAVITVIRVVRVIVAVLLGGNSGGLLHFRETTMKS